MATIPRIHRHHDYTIAWISALPLEMAAAAAMLDERHPDLPTDLSDNNSYIFGSIHGHNVVIVCLPAGVYGTTSAAVIASATPSQGDIRLGDVVVSQPTRDYGGIVQYDYGKTLSNNRFERTGMLNKPPSVLLTAVSKLQAEHMVRPSNIPTILSEMVCRYPKMKDKFTYRGAEQDVLFEPDYDHEDSGITCANCDFRRRETRPDRGYDVPVVHYGLIASANQVMKNGRIRDQLANEFGILCFEMEAAGLMDNFPCLVIRGICDYADSHKNKQWQEYAAATAAAYTKELLSMIHTKQLVDMPSPHLLERISNYDHDKVHQRLAYKRLPGTTQWFLNHATYKAWLTRLDQSSLWCSGKIGSGKTIIAASVVEAVKYRALGNSSCQCPTVIFYCENKHSGSLQASYILASLIKQLAQLLYESHQVFPPDVAHELERFFGRDRRVPDYDDLREIFNLLFSYMPNTIYVLDGLDALEQQECQKMLLLIRATFSSASPPNGSKIMLLSRNHVPGYVNIATFMPWALRISTFNHVTQDIEFYIKASIDDKSMLRKLTSDCSLLEEIKRVLLTEASGMFLWVYLVLEILWSTCFTDAEVRSALRRLPKGLKETYRLCTQRIASDPRAAKVLKWVSFATRPLHIDELKEAVAFDLHDTRWDHEKVPQDEFVLGCCANLVVQDPTDGCVRFAHSSVKKFLLSHRADHETRYLESEARGNLQCGEFCVAYLSFSNFSLQVETQGRDHNSTGLTVVSPALLAGEAMKSSLFSLFRAPKIQKASIKLPIRPVCTDSPGEQFKFLDYASPVEQHIPLLRIVMSYKEELAKICNLPLIGESLPALHFASRFGFTSIVRRLLNLCEINLPDLEGYTPLHHAAEKGHPAVVSTLLREKSIAINSKSRIQATPLWLAARNGHLDVLKARSIDGQAPISIARQNRHEKVVNLLFGKGSTILFVRKSLAEIASEWELGHVTDDDAIRKFEQHLSQESDTPQAVKLRENRIWKTNLEEKACAPLLKRFRKHEAELRKALNVRKKIDIAEVVRGQVALESLQQLSSSHQHLFQLNYLGYVLYKAGAAAYTNSYGWPGLTESVLVLCMESLPVFLGIMSGEIAVSAGFRQLADVRNRLLVAGSGAAESFWDRSHFVQQGPS
ncbi:uncharacterized protein BO66DRAFT_408681 [Aspergillus aculeatinus CBS 121060]|uniref:Uncharacterized protein n=1 Tax=Aspergillus aculeatinus CBS 121060 TaxID=1448322 RepID=A0ACD1HJN6_9EURO|nr:hypothetical protein BO66DRAFT_408681 [Aspergillus aculeatinus CBS 121060]RAH73770.1 hypothetical protein BO66DRAFT_408681 [Aspergillus aculeatinus CBS 121060]